MSATLRSQFDVSGDVATAFDQLVEDLVAGLERQGLSFTPGPQGRVLAGSDLVAEVVDWQPASHVLLAWAESEMADSRMEVEIVFKSTEVGTNVTFDVRNWANALGPWGDVSGWFATQVAAPFFRAASLTVIGAWCTNRSTSP